MFSLKEFIKKGLLDAVGKMADYQVRLNAVGWYEKGVFEDETLLFEETLRHSTEEISQYGSIVEQKDFRKKIITDLLEKKNFCDMSGNNVNHPNDFLARAHAQTILAQILD